MSRALVACVPACPRMMQATSEPRRVEAAASSSRGASGGATSAAPSGWVAGADPAALNLAVRDMEDRFLTQNATLLRAREEMLATRLAPDINHLVATVRVL